MYKVNCFIRVFRYCEVILSLFIIYFSFLKLLLMVFILENIKVIRWLFVEGGDKLVIIKYLIGEVIVNNYGLYRMVGIWG